MATLKLLKGDRPGLRHPVFFIAMCLPVIKAKQYPAHLWLCYRGVKYRPAALQLFVANGGWGEGYRSKPVTQA